MFILLFLLSNLSIAPLAHAEAAGSCQEDLKPLLMAEDTAKLMEHMRGQDEKCVTETARDASAEADNSIAAIEKSVCQLRNIEELQLWTLGYENCTGKEAHDIWNSYIQKAEADRKSAKTALTKLPRSVQNLDQDSVDELKATASIAAKDMVLIKNYIHKGYKRLNQALRSGGKSAYCVRNLVTAFNQVLKKFPVFKGTVWRGLNLNPEDLRKYVVGAEFSWDAYSSTSLDRETAKVFSMASAPEVATIFEIYSSKCRDLTHLNAREKEVICLPGTRLKVTGIHGNEIKLEEVVD